MTSIVPTTLILLIILFVIKHNRTDNFVDYIEDIQRNISKILWTFKLKRLNRKKNSLNFQLNKNFIKFQIKCFKICNLDSCIKNQFVNNYIKMGSKY